MPTRKSRRPEALEERRQYRENYYKKSYHYRHRHIFVLKHVYDYLVKGLKIPSLFCKVEFIKDDNIKILVPKKYKTRVRKTINEIWYVETELVIDAIIITEIDEWKSLK